MIKLKSLLNEYLTQNVQYLKRYLSMSEDEKKEDLAHDKSYMVSDWLEDVSPEVAQQYGDREGYDILEDLMVKHPQLYSEFKDWVYSQLERGVIPSDEAPAWAAMEYRGIVKNQWLIHFSDFSKEIWRIQSFKYGMDDISRLAYTTYYNDSAKQYGGFNFAYKLSDFKRYGRADYGRGWKYGNEAVMFVASGVQVFHYGDEEPQVIFEGKSASNIVYLRDIDGDWAVVNTKTNNIIFRGDLDNVVDWVTANFNQYKNVLLP